MSESKQQPKILLHKPKKSQRSPSGVPAADSSGNAGVGGGRPVSTASKAPLSEPPPPANPPAWYRFRTALTTLLVVNAVLVGYALLRTSIKPGDPSTEADTPIKDEREKEENAKEIENETVEIVDKKKETVELPEGKVSVVSESEKQESSRITLETNRPPQQSSNVKDKPKPLNEEQQELYKWMLEEKRKSKPVTKAEKAQIDAEKALLKDFLRRKGILDL